MTLQVCVLGGTGFIGREIVSRLAAAGHGVKVLTRNPARHRELKVLPSVRFIRADVHDEARLEDAFEGCDVVINLVGILNETGLGRGNGEQFRRVHTRAAAEMRACVPCGGRAALPAHERAQGRLAAGPQSLPASPRGSPKTTFASTARQARPST